MIKALPAFTQPEAPCDYVTRSSFAMFLKTLLLFAAFFAFTGNAAAQVEVTASAGTTAASYTSVNAAFVAINAGTHQGQITILVTGNTTEPAATALVASGQGSAVYTSVLIRPSVTATISGAPAASRAVLEFSGADNVTINGDIAGGSTGRDLTIINTSANTVVSAVIRYAGATTGGLGAINNVVENTIIVGNVDPAGTSNTAQFGIYAAGSTTTTTLSQTGTGDNFDNLIIRNNEFSRAKTAIYVGGTNANQADNLIIENNIIGTANPTTYVTWKGIAVTGVVNAIIEGNTIQNMISSISSSSSTGIDIGSTSTNSGVIVRRNMISGIHNLNTGGYASMGIHLGGGNNHIVANNVIYDIKGTNYSSTTTTFTAFGVRIAGGTGHKVYYNSVNLFGTINLGTSASTSVAFAVTSTSATGLDIRNNIFQNKQVSTVNGFKAYAVRFASGYAFATSGLIMDNNAYYVPSANTATTSYFVGGVYSGTDAVALSAWATLTQGAVASNDQNSIPGSNANAPFVSDTDLTIPAGTATEIESKGVTITELGNPNTDFTGTSRPVGPFNGSANSAPDLGAYEFSGTPADFTPPSISYTPLTNTCDANARVLTATITDSSGIPTSGAGIPVLYYKVNSGTYTAVTGVSIGNNQYTFTFGAGTGVSDMVSYYIIAQDMASTPNVASSPGGASGFTSSPPAATTPPTAPSVYYGPLQGVYTVGAGGNFTTLTSAIAIYNTSCITGHVTFLLTDATYPGETFPLTINSNIYAAADKTLTIKPATGVTAVVSGSNSTAILRLSGADYVTIDGSNNGTNSRNLTIANTSSSTSPAVIYLASATANGATNNTIKNLIVTGNSSTSTFGAIISSSGTTIGGVAEAANSNNSYINNVISGAQWGMALVGPEGNESGTVVTGNLIGGTTAATRIGLRGIGIFQQQGVIISDNIVSGVYTSSTSISSGIYIAGAQSGGSITRNIVKDVRNTNTTGYGANGIQLGSSSTTGNVTVSNNFIYDIAGNGYSAGIAENDNGYGILVNAGGGYKIYYNSVWLNTNQTVAGLSAAINITNSVTTPNALDIRNNIFSNTQTTGTQRYAIYSGAAATVFEFLDYNDYYSAGGLNLGFIGSMRSNLAAWKTGTGKDVHSKSVNPNFTSATDLHITGASELESTGIAVSVTTDFDGQTRPGPADSVNGGGTAPDIGADEFDGIPADLTPPVITYTPLIATCSTDARTLTATITDELSPVPTSGSGLPVLYYRVNAGAYTAVQGVSIGNNQFEFTFGNGVAIADVVSYYIVAQDGATVPNVIAFPQTGTGGYTASPPASATPPSAPSSYAIQNTLSGTFTVGAGGNYPTITAAVNAYNNGCLSGPVTFVLTDASYVSPAETYPITINANPFSSSTNTLTIKPNAGVTAAITGSSANGIFKLNGADYVTIDGSNNGTSSQNLTITNNSTATSAVIWNASMGGAGNGATHNTFKNLTVVGGSSSSSGVHGIVSSSTTGVTTAGEDNDNFTIQNNSVSKVYVGISSLSSSAAGLAADGLLITGNSVGSNTATNIVYSRGIQISNAVSPVISGNTIFNMKISASLSNAGIDIGENVINGQVINNIITGIHSTSTSGYGAYGINFSSNTGTTNVLVANNSISDLRTANYSSTSTIFNAFGIRVTGGSDLKFYHNTVNMYGPVTGGSSSGLSANMLVTSAVTGLDVRNNIFANTQTFSANNSGVYNIYLAAIPTGYTIDYNNYYGTSVASTTYRVGYASTPKADLVAWAATTGQDLHSSVFMPTFVSDTDLHLVPASNGNLNNTGVVIAAVTTDIDGNTRGTTATDMGIDEFTGPACISATGGVAATTSLFACSGTAATITNTGYSTGEGSAYMWESSLDNFATAPVATGSTTPSSFNTGALTQTTYFRLAVQCATDSSIQYSNVVMIEVRPVPTATASNGGTICEGEALILTGTTNIGTTYSWTGPNGFTSTELNPTIPNATAAASGIYTFVATLNGCSSVPATTTVTVNRGVNAATATAPAVVCQDGTLNLTSSATSSGYTLNANCSTGFIDIGTSGTSIGSITDDSEHNITLPFSFNFNGTNYTTARVGVNGAVAFGATSGDVDCCPSVCLPTSFGGAGSQGIAVFWDDLDLSTLVTSSIRTQQVGSVYIIQWTDIAHDDFQGGAMTFQVQLEQTTNKITLVYQDVVLGLNTLDNGQNAIIGLRFDATSALQYACKSASLSNGQCISFTPNTITSYAWTGPDNFTSSVQNPVISNVTGAKAGTYTVTFTNNFGCTATASTTIGVTTATITAQTNVTCNGGNNGEATVTAAGGTLPYTYTWNTVPAQNTATAVGLVAGTYSVIVADNAGCSITVPVTITQPSALDAIVSDQTNVSCNGGANGSATITTTGGTGTYTYLWAPTGGTAATATGLAAGTYTVTITDANLCSTTATVTITEPAALSASISAQTNVACFDGATGSATVSVTGGTGGYTYLWTNSAGTAATASNLEAGTYTVTVTDDNGCTATATAIITEPATAVSASITAQTNNICFGNATGTATVLATGGTPGYSYSWAPSGGTAATATGLAAGTYTVTITDANGCTTTATANITEPTPLSASVSAQTNVACSGNATGSATVSVTGGTGAYTYLWAPLGGTGATATGLAAGTYTVTITDANGCTTTTTATITEPAAALSATVTAQTNVACFGNSTGSATVNAAGGTGAYTYSWAPSGGTAATATGLAAGTYTVTVTDANGCTATATANITEPAIALSATITAQVNVGCFGNATGSATVMAAGGTPGYTYSWAPSGGTAATATGLAAGTYTVTITDANGCSATATANITEPAATLSASITSQTNVDCFGNATGSATVSATGGTGTYTYLWAPSGGTAATATGLAAATYTVTVTDANGCVTTATVNITEPAAALSASITAHDNVSVAGGSDGSATVTATAGTAPYTYSWNTTPPQTTATATNLEAGIYTVTVTDANNCTTTAIANITAPGCAVTLTASHTNVSCFSGANGTATVVPDGGIEPYTYLWSNGGTTATISGLAAGTYTVTVTDDAGCTATGSAVITQPTVLNALAAAQTNVSCNSGANGSATVSVTGGTGAYTYSWAPSGGTAATATGLAAGTYTVTVTDANLCQATRSFTITQPPALTATTSQTNIACNGASTGIASVTVTGGTGAYTYAWAPSGGTAATATGLAAGTYTVTVTDANLCQITRNFTITQPTVVNATAGAQTNVSCNGGANGSATVTVTGGTGAYTYAWAPSGGTAATATGLAAGTYTVTVTDANGCFDTQSFTITQPTVVNATAGAQTNVSCNGGANGSATVAVTGGTGAYTYAWAPSGGTAATATGLAAGTYTVTVTDTNGCFDTQSFTITQPTVVNATAGTQTNVSCNGGANGSATVAVTGGTGTYTYFWAPSGGTAATATGLAAGTYTVTVTDANGCFDTQSFTITQPTVVNATAGAQTNVSCNGGANGSATVAVTGGTGAYTYSWAPSGGTAATATGLAAGTYTVTVTDANGCFDTQSFTITQPTVVNATAGTQTNVSCNGGANGSATVAVTGGTGTYTYFWAPSGGTAATATGLAAGTYTVTVTDANGCFDTQSFTITQPTVVNATAGAQTNVSCNGGANGSATVAVTGGTGAYTYAWAPSGGTAATATGLAAGTYTVTVTDANGCTDTQSFTITQPTVVNATAGVQTNVSCNGGANGSATVAVTGGTGAYTYAWAPSGGTAATATGLAAGTYTVTVTDANGCFDTQSFTITQPTVVNATAGAQTNVSCNGGANGSATVAVTGGTGAYTYSWAPSGGTAATATGLAAGTYTVTVTDANGCFDTQSFTITQPTVVNATAGAQTNVSCNGGTNGSATVNVTGGTGVYTYAWAPSGGTAATANGLAAGTYTVTVTDANGCTDAQSFTITQPTVVDATAGAQTNVSCNGGANGSATVNVTGGTGAYTYSWAPSGGTSATATGLAAGTYTVTVTDANGCTDTQSFTITEPETLEANITAQINAGCNGASDGSATVTVTGGTESYTYSWAPSGGTAATATGLAAGTYTVTITDANGCTTTASATITEPDAVIINIQPGDESTTTGGNADFTIDASNVDSYQWQVSSNGTDWSDITDGGTNPEYVGATTDILSLTNVPSGFNGLQYRVILTNGTNCETISGTATININNVISAVNDDFSTIVINEGIGGVAGDVTANDLLNGAAVTDTEITIAVADNDGMEGVTIDENGNLTIPATADQGTYTITYTICEVAIPANCSTAEVIVVVSPPLKVDDNKFAQLSIYPNPASSEVFIRIPDIANHKNAKVIIYDTNGRMIMQQDLNTVSESVDIRSLQDAVYILEITSDIGKTIKRIVKKP